MPRPDQRRASGSATQGSQQNVAPQGLPGGLTVNPIGSVGGQQNAGLQMGQQGRIVSAGTGLAQALGGLNAGVQGGLQNYDKFETIVAEENWANFESAYQQESIRVNGNAEKLDQWLQTNTYVPNRKTSRRYWSLRGQVQGKAYEEYQRDELLKMDTLMSKMTPDEQMSYISSEIDKWDEDSMVYQSLRSSLNKAQAGVTSANHQLSLTHARDTYADKIDAETKRLLDAGIVPREVVGTGYYRRAMEAIQVLPGTEGFSYDPEKGAITVDGETRSIGAEFDDQFDAKLKAKLSDWGTQSTANGELLTAVMSVSTPRRAASAGPMTAGEKSSTALGMVKEAFRQGNLAAPAVGDGLLPALDKLVSAEKDPTQVLQGLYGEIVNDQTHSFGDKRRALLAVDSMFDFESNQAYWERRGYDSQDVLDKLRKDSGLDAALEQAILGETSEVNQKFLSVFRSQPGGNRAVLDPQAIAVAQTRAIQELTQTYASISGGFTVRIGDEEYGHNEFANRLAAGEFDLATTQAQIFINPTGRGPLSRMNIQIPLGDDIIVLGGKEEPIEEGVLKQVGAFQQMMNDSNNFASVMSIGEAMDRGELDPAMRPMENDVLRAYRFALATGNPADAVALMRMNAYSADPLISQLTEEEQGSLAKYLIQGGVDSQGNEIPGVTVKGVEDFIAGEQTPEAGRIAELSTLLGSDSLRSQEFKNLLQKSGLAGQQSLWMITDGAMIATRFKNAGMPISSADLRAAYQMVISQGMDTSKEFDAIRKAATNLRLVDNPSLTGSTNPVVNAAMQRLGNAWASSGKSDLDLVDALRSDDPMVATNARRWVDNSINSWSSTGAVVKYIQSNTGVPPETSRDLALDIVTSATLAGASKPSNPSKGVDINRTSYDPSNQGLRVEEQVSSKLAGVFFARFTSDGVEDGMNRDAFTEAEKKMATDFMDSMLKDLPNRFLTQFVPEERFRFFEKLSRDRNEAQAYLLEAYDGEVEKAEAAMWSIERAMHNMVKITPNRNVSDGSRMIPAGNGYYSREVFYNIEFAENAFKNLNDYGDDDLYESLRAKTLRVSRLQLIGGAEASGDKPYKASDPTIFIPKSLTEERKREANELDEKIPGPSYLFGM